MRLGFLCACNAVLVARRSLIRMSTFSLVGAVVPVAAAGSLFAGFMSVTNLAYSFSYSSGAWLYEHGMAVGAAAGRAGSAVRHSAAGPADKLSMKMLILIGSARVLRELRRRARAARTRGDAGARPATSRAAGPERWLALPAGLRRAVNVGALVARARRCSPG